MLSGAFAFLISGCGGESDIAPEKKSAGTKPIADSTTADSKTTADTKPADTKPVKVISNLPHKDLDPMSTDKGVEPGRLLIDVAGKDSNGKSLKLSDYKGKVILLDVWASW